MDTMCSWKNDGLLQVTENTEPVEQESRCQCEVFMLKQRGAFKDWNYADALSDMFFSDVGAQQCWEKDIIIPLQEKATTRAALKAKKRSTTTTAEGLLHRKCLFVPAE